MKKHFLIILVLLLLSGTANADKNILIFNKCYEPKLHDNFNQLKNSGDYTWDEWSFEINLKKNIIIRTIIWSDRDYKKTIERSAKITKHELDTYQIKSFNSKFVQMKEDKTGFIYTFNIKNGELFIQHADIGTNLKYQCDID